MRVCVIGFGVIGTIYGWAFAESGLEVVHCVRHGSSAARREEVVLSLLDARGGEFRECRVSYRPQLVESLAAADPDLVLASVRHYQLADLLPLLTGDAGRAEILFFNNLWTSFEPIDVQLRGRFLWGFPVAGGGFEDGVLEAALLGNVQLGAPPGVDPQRVSRVAALFAGCRREVELQDDMLGWLWTHFAIEAGVIATAIKAGGVQEFLADVDRIAEAVLAVRDALAVVEARGVDPRSIPDAQMFFAPERDVANGIHALYASDRAARKIMERHTGGEELKRIYGDVLRTGRELGVEMPTLEPLERFVTALDSSRPTR